MLSALSLSLSGGIAEMCSLVAVGCQKMQLYRKKEEFFSS
jgi:hypothetical protein